ncbi:DNA polymerase III subunit gamma/tau C-terminal domain-containing protein, partial [Undibacterium sp.]|uniref:DNA polymerase III subunit gamma/tau C-terminal domain-containing protein n=1 Tax=Undibacterium sp. TaxID=1914977 RepID=UPI002C96F874
SAQARPHQPVPAAPPAPSMASAAASAGLQKPSSNATSTHSVAAANTPPQAAAPAAKSALSPAMAALAAARSGVNKPAANAPGAAAKPAPVEAVAAVVQAAPVIPAAAVAPVAMATVSQPQLADPIDDMPPPWDDDVMLSTTRPGGNAPAKAAGPAANPWDDVPEESFGESLAASMGTVQHAADASMQGAPGAVLAEELVAETALDAPLVQFTTTAAIAPRPASFTPVAELGWDGHWPNLAAALPVRGVAQQLAQQSELVLCELNGNAVVFNLRVPLATLLSAGSVDKLTAALSERFERTVRVDTQIGAVEQTANAQAIAERAARQQMAEKSIQNDSFIQTLMREFGATIVTGSIKPV